MNASDLRGAHSALYTPFTASGEVDLPALKALCQRLVDAGIGLVPCGTTGETPTLRREEYDLVVRTAVEVAVESRAAWRARGATPPLVIVTHNTWLIPFGAPWMLGRAGRLIDHQCAVVQRLRDEASEDPLVIVALQELWAFRAGLFWPLLWLIGVLQSALLRAGLEKLPQAVALVK